jgi:hypothetical protein
VLEHPLDRIPEGGLRRWQIPSVAIAATCLISLRVVLPPREAHTVVDWVVSGTVQTAAAILEHWNHEDRIRLA